MVRNGLSGGNVTRKASPPLFRQQALPMENREIEFVFVDMLIMTAHLLLSLTDRILITGVNMGLSLSPTQMSNVNPKAVEGMSSCAEAPYHLVSPSPEYNSRV